MSHQLGTLRQHAPAPCYILAWDTEFWGRPIARVGAASVTPDSVRAIDAWCSYHAVACVYLLLDGMDSASTLAAERGGFFLTDVRVTFRADLHNRTTQARPNVRPAQPRDREPLADLARVGHDTTRFFHDPHFDRERCGELYGRWMLSSLDGGAAAVLVAEADGVLVGYVTCELDEDGDVGRIGLIAVAESTRRQGVGQELCEAAFDWFKEQGAESAEIVTQGRNLAGQRVFQRAGAHADTLELWFHKWYQPLRPTT